ncbi:MAG: flagellar hook-associated protein FlgK [Acidobacteria bacterium]|nr:flagellar hook-associated protein FlgK [Acidobacteriota bacterium]
MSINFSAFEIGRRALNANQYGINITGQNIANVNTPGYSRRQAILQESTTAELGVYRVGTGVTVHGVQSFRDNLIQSRIQTETGIAGRLTAFRDTMSPVEVALQGSDSGGLQNAMGQFFGAFRDLDANPNSVSLRSVVVQRGVNLVNSFQATRSKLDNVRIDTDGQIRTAVDQVNTLAEHIASLNGEIRNADSVGADTGALKDQRSELIEQISDLAGVHQTINADGTVNLTIGDGRSLVSGNASFKLTASTTPPYGFATITLDGQPANFEEGKIRGFQDAMTETTNQITSLDGLADAMMQRVNGLHISGTDLDGASGDKFFTSGSPTTAGNIAVNPLLVANPRMVVASPVTQPGQSGTVAGQIANLLTDQSTQVGSKTGSFSSIYGSMLTDAGEKINSAESDLQTQAAIIAQTTAQRDAVSGVSLDEEAINLMQYQKAFEAAARFIKVADEMTQTILSLGQ